MDDDWWLEKSTAKYNAWKKEGSLNYWGSLIDEKN